jgi:hypothetical protein
MKRSPKLNHSSIPRGRVLRRSHRERTRNMVNTVTKGLRFKNAF